MRTWTPERPGEGEAVCHACGLAFRKEEPVCPRCQVPRKGDVNRPAIAAFSFFLILSAALAVLVMVWLNGLWARY